MKMLDTLVSLGVRQAVLTSNDGLVIESAGKDTPHPDFLLALGDHYLRRGRARDAVAVAQRLMAAAPGSFAVTAVPVAFGSTGRRTFYMDANKVIRQNWSQEPANAQSEELR